MVGHKTESIYRRYSIVDQAMLEVGARKLDQLQQAQGLSKPVVVSIRPTLTPGRTSGADDPDLSSSFHKAHRQKALLGGVADDDLACLIGGMIRVVEDARVDRRTR